MLFRHWEATLDFTSRGRTGQVKLHAGNGAADGPLRLEVLQDTLPQRNRLRFQATADTPIILKSLTLHLPLDDLAPETLFLANGYQSWSISREYSARDNQHHLSPLVHRWLPHLALDRYGDAFLRPPPQQQKGRFDGWSWTWLRRPGSHEGRFLASGNEEVGFTRFTLDYPSKTLTVEKDLEGLMMTESRVLLDLMDVEGDLHLAARQWANLLGLSSAATPWIAGWTSWYSYYQNIREDVLLENLDALVRRGIPLQVFQIDDGYQSAVGDWLLPQAGFPRGMRDLAERIHQAGFRAGIWLAPLAAQTSSRLVREHPNWLLTDAAGRPLLGGGNWGGFYVLDILEPEVQEHLELIFRTVVQDWGYDFLKLDFLYASCLLPRQGKSRAQIMALTMDLLRRWAKDATILACGVPLASALGRCDYCRIGTDVEARWGRPLYERFLHPEIPSTRRSLGNTLSRAFLDGLGFRNDPDVFFLRRHANRLTPRQRHSLFLLNYLLGGVWMTSDPVEDWDQQSLNLYLAGFPRPEFDETRVISERGLWMGSFGVQDRRYLWAFNPRSRRRTWHLPSGWYSPCRPWQGESCSEPGFFPGPREIPLEGFETRLFRVLDETDAPQVLGSVGHILSGTEVQELQWPEADGGPRVVWMPGLRVHAQVWVGRLGGEVSRLDLF